MAFLEQDNAVRRVVSATHLMGLVGGKGYDHPSTNVFSVTSPKHLQQATDWEVNLGNDDM